MACKLEASAQPAGRNPSPAGASKALQPALKARWRVQGGVGLTLLGIVLMCGGAG